MDWKRRWRELASPADADAHRDAPTGSTETDEPASIEDWTARLTEHGIERDCALRLAPVLRDHHREAGRGSASALLKGAVSTMQIQSETQATIERRLHEVHEVERLLGAFSGELQKLDEVLEVLSAYAQRMRSQPAHKAPRAARRLLH